ncbi:EAP30/Vps36 family protein [Leishmania donovani]|uniref:EAP30/Vps36 family protein n=1 Tax=Leishmania donovani TaxID=5661 RepID=A0A504XWI7_LEIDO|nr:EAP30/Vps36 family protein [Leishmania donovani]
MRRRVGVGHVLQERQQQQRMADLGAQITAERVGQIEDQLEELQAQLKALAQNHKSEITEDPVVRARFRQLADSLGVDLISSKKNVFADALGLGDFYYQLASRTVEVCMRERKFCGAYVPLQRVQFFVQKAYDASSLLGGNAQNLLGAGYNVVKLGGVSYIQTTPDGARGGDHVLLLNYVLGLQKEKIEKAKQAAVEEQRKSAPMASEGSTRATAVGGSGHRSGVGAAYALGAHPFDLGKGKDSETNVSLSFSQQCVAVRESQVASGLHWETHRARAALKRMVQEGTVWVEESQDKSVGRVTTAGARGGSPAKSKAILSSTEEVKEVWKRKHTRMAEAADKKDVVYWFVSLTSHG